MNNPLLGIIIFYIVVGLGVFALKYIVPSVGKTCGKTIYYLNDRHFNLWNMSHVLFYVALGYLFPEYWYLCMYIGVTWEIFETALCKCSETITGKPSHWDSAVADIGYNCLGFLIGAGARTAIGAFA